MADYNDVIKQFKRMCGYYSRGKVQKSCPMCTSYPNCNIGQCRKIAFEQAAHFAATVMCWAAEHPEPVYPTWSEWLYEQGVLGDKYVCSIPELIVSNVATDKVDDTIPADIAQKLGLQPKEG